MNLATLGFGDITEFKIVVSVCLYRSPLLFVPLSVLAWLLSTVDVVAVKSFYIVECFLLLFVVSVLECAVGLVYVYSECLFRITQLL